MKDQLLTRPKIPEAGIIILDDNTGPGTHWVGYAIHPKSIIHFDSYELPSPREIVKYVSKLSTKVWYSTLATQPLTDPSTCGREVLNGYLAKFYTAS